MAITKNPAKPSYIYYFRVCKMNFATHLMWLAEMCLISWSVLLYSERIFSQVIDRERITRKQIRWERPLLHILYTTVFLWFLSSVLHSPSATWFSVNGRQVLFTVFQDGLKVDHYWRLGPNTVYVARIWYTNLFHIILDVIILALPGIWIRRARLGWSRKLTLIYLLLFLSGFL